MPRASKSINNKPCEICNVTIRHKTDISRHMKLHSRQKSSMTYKCPVKGCTYEGMQLSNLRTHVHTHTGNKPHACDTCTFTTSDPGALTRHKKKLHGYIPRPYKKRAKAAAPKLEYSEPHAFSPLASPKVQQEEPVDLFIGFPEKRNDDTRHCVFDLSLPAWDTQLPDTPQPDLALEFFRTVQLPLVDSTLSASTIEELDALSNHIAQQFEAFLAQYHSDPPASTTDIGVITQPTLEQTLSAPGPWEYHLNSTTDESCFFPLTFDCYGQPANCSTAPEFDYPSSSPSLSSLPPYSPYSQQPLPDCSYYLPSPLPLYDPAFC